MARDEIVWNVPVGACFDISSVENGLRDCESSMQDEHH